MARSSPLSARVPEGALRLFAAAIACGSLLLSAPASACKCMLPPVESARDDATAVFEGRVLSIAQAAGSEATNGQLGVTLRVVRTWKGLERDERITVLTNGSSAACGYSFREDTSYLIYARRSDDHELHVSGCSRTKSMADASEDLAFLGAGSTPVAIEKSVANSLDGGVASTTGYSDGGAGLLPPPTPVLATPYAVKKKGCSVSEGNAASTLEAWLVALPGVLLVARRRRQRV
ncbi:MAG: hypothetical protein JWN04_6199 [Myxococcaceae bacterium]|nr:hypothetical protein [Myxococcaceae bacterium]